MYILSTQIHFLYDRSRTRRPFHKFILWLCKKRISTSLIQCPPTYSPAMPSIYLFAGRIHCASPIKLPRFRNKNKKSKKTTSAHESDPSLYAADEMVLHPPFLLRKPSLANVSCAGTSSTNSLTSCSSSESLAFRPMVSVSSDDSTLQLPEMELLPAEPFYFQNTDLPSSASDDEWGHFVDFAG